MNDRTGTTMRFGFMGITDEDLSDIIERLKGNEDVVELDLANNKIMDKGMQPLVRAPLTNKSIFLTPQS